MTRLKLKGIKMFDQKPYTFDTFVKIILAAGIFAASIWLLKHLSMVLLPFAIALLLAYFINPVVEFFERKIKNRNRTAF